MKKLLFRDQQYGVGVLLAGFNTLVYLLSINIKGDDALPVFFLTFFASGGYWLSVLISATFRRKTYRFCRIFPALVLSLVSAYTLNRMMNVFDASPWWFTVILTVVSIACLSLAFYKEMPQPVRILTLAVTGVGLVVFIYLAVYLTPIYAFSVAFFWILGISLHSFVPLLFVIFLLRWLFKFAGNDKKALNGLFAGAGTVIVVIIVFAIRWHSVVGNINDTYRESFTEDDVILPAWVRVAQRVPKNEMTNMVLKAGLTYTLPSPELNPFRFDIPSSQFTEQKIHNPLIVIATFFGGRINREAALSDRERIKILESIYDSRQQATERLWSDEDVKTTYVNSNILIWTQYRTAYTEQIIMLRNDSEYDWQNGEAVYTFHLPEGSVVTSLSLWINDVEEKGILTSKDKAETAYRTIVGVEQRDPSLVTWQEGSTVNVRVFPVTSKEERIFKIGITTPLRLDGQQLVYEPVYFEGTDAHNAKQNIKVQWMQAPEEPDYPDFFKQEDSELVAKKNGHYSNQWAIRMKNTEISEAAFHFDGCYYKIQQTQMTEIPVSLQYVYLDINRSWTKEEFHEAVDAAAAQNCEIRIFNGQQMLTVTDKNKDILFTRLNQLQFSLFPIHLIAQPEHSLLVSKSASAAPNLSDLKGTPFFSELSQNVTSKRPIYFFHFGNELSPYLKTLREYRLLNYATGNMKDLQQMLIKGVWRQASVESDSCVTVHDAGINIIKQQAHPSTAATDAPDHLMRLFAYNHIMLQYAANWNATEQATEQMVAEAQQAYVVSPVSSLVVLETQQDYERFDIKDTENSLHNASKKSKGAIPEPHEWALIAIAVVIGGFLFYRRRMMNY
ncbi:MAG: XrtN system VIT domain-containing protein [Bacteroidales bacterium]|jgi:XrtN system VIT domain protein|nr:XrtN system VIT domain-containing protein [Bacteroidales bacterium]